MGLISVCFVVALSNYITERSAGTKEDIVNLRTDLTTTDTQLKKQIETMSDAVIDGRIERALIKQQLVQISTTLSEQKTTIDSMYKAVQKLTGYNDGTK